MRLAHVLRCSLSTPPSTSSMTTNVMQRKNEDKAQLTRELLELEQVGEDKFRATSLLQGRMMLDAIYGGQACSTVLQAACRTVRANLLPHVAHSFFIKSVYEPLELVVKRIRDGKSYSTRQVEARQADVLLTSATVSFHAPEPPAITHSAPMPRFPNPESLKSLQVVLAEALDDKTHPGLNKFTRTIIEQKMLTVAPILYTIFDVRPVEPLTWSWRTSYPRHEAPTLRFYIKAKHKFSDDQKMHRTMAYLLSDIAPMETAITSHVAAGFFPNMIFSLDNCVYFHDDVDCNEWMLIECTSPIAAGGRAYAEAKTWSADGRLVMSVSQEGVIRGDKPKFRAAPTKSSCCKS